MKNGQLKAAYNVQLSTADQYIANYSIHPNPTDTATFKKHIEQHYQNYHEYPLSITADAGYGSEENLQYLEDEGIEGYVKYASFDKEQSSKSNKKKPFAAETLYYNENKDCYYCPMGQAIHCIGRYKKTTSTGFEQTIKRYQAGRCNGCPIAGCLSRLKT